MIQKLNFQLKKYTTKYLECTEIIQGRKNKIILNFFIILTERIFQQQKKVKISSQIKTRKEKLLAKNEAHVACIFFGKGPSTCSSLKDAVCIHNFTFAAGFLVCLCLFHISSRFTLSKI